MPQSPVIFNHDAAIDEYMALVLLTTMETVDLQAAIITGADCVPDAAMDTSWKIQSYIEQTGLPVGLSQVCGWNPFPWAYRGDCFQQGSIEALRGVTPNLDWPPYPDGDALLAELLAKAAAGTKVTLLVNCPLKTLQATLAANPGLEQGIERVIWMGGAINVPGNLDPTTVPYQVANPSAEWNAFWDPVSVDWIFKNTSFPITLFPLDVTDDAPISEQFMQRLAAQRQTYRYSDLAYQSYGLVSSEPFYDMWDTLTTSYLVHPEFFEPPTLLNVSIVTEGFYQGTLQVVESGGRAMEVVLKLTDSEGFYDYMLQQFRR